MCVMVGQCGGLPAESVVSSLAEAAQMLYGWSRCCVLCVLRCICHLSPPCCTGRRGPSPMMECGRLGSELAGLSVLCLMCGMVDHVEDRLYCEFCFGSCRDAVWLESVLLALCAAI